MALLSAAGTLLLTEAVCRWVIGLGEPPLYQKDDQIEYLLQPSRSYQRFHHLFKVNRYSMRSDDFPLTKESPAEFRVLLVGDSIIYSGVQIDQREMASELLKRALESRLHRPVTVGNASAKSWGPPNELAYLQRFGTFDADVVVLVLSSHDFADAPTFTPLVGVAPEYPSRQPFSALDDLIRTYLLPRLSKLQGGSGRPDEDTLNTIISPERIAACSSAEREFFHYARNHKARVALVQHLTREEIQGAYGIGYRTNRSIAQQMNVPVVDDAAALRGSTAAGQEPYLDGFHLNATGHRRFAEVLDQGITKALESH